MGVGGQPHAPAALPPGTTRYPLYGGLGGPQDRSGQVRKISSPSRFDPRTVHLVSSRYTVSLPQGKAAVIHLTGGCSIRQWCTRINRQTKQTQLWCVLAGLLSYSTMECPLARHWCVFTFMLMLGALKRKKGYLLCGTRDVTRLYQ